jgi:hypothetical protein
MHLKLLKKKLYEEIINDFNKNKDVYMFYLSPIVFKLKTKDFKNYKYSLFSKIKNKELAEFKTYKLKKYLKKDYEKDLKTIIKIIFKSNYIDENNKYALHYIKKLVKKPSKLCYINLIYRLLTDINKKTGGRLQIFRSFVYNGLSNLTAFRNPIVEKPIEKKQEENLDKLAVLSSVKSITDLEIKRMKHNIDHIKSKYSNTESDFYQYISILREQDKIIKESFAIINDEYNNYKKIIDSYNKIIILYNNYLLQTKSLNSENDINTQKKYNKYSKYIFDNDDYYTMDDVYDYIISKYNDLISSYYNTIYKIKEKFIKIDDKIIYNTESSIFIELLVNKIDDEQSILLTKTIDLINKNSNFKDYLLKYIDIKNDFEKFIADPINNYNIIINIYNLYLLEYYYNEISNLLDIYTKEYTSVRNNQTSTFEKIQASYQEYIQSKSIYDKYRENDGIIKSYYSSINNNSISSDYIQEYNAIIQLLNQYINVNNNIIKLLFNKIIEDNSIQKEIQEYNEIYNEIYKKFNYLNTEIFNPNNYYDTIYSYISNKYTDTKITIKIISAFYYSFILYKILKIVKHFKNYKDLSLTNIDEYIKTINLSIYDKIDKDKDIDISKLNSDHLNNSIYALHLYYYLNDYFHILTDITYEKYISAKKFVIDLITTIHNKYVNENQYLNFYKQLNIDNFILFNSNYPNINYAYILIIYIQFNIKYLDEIKKHISEQNDEINIIQIILNDINESLKLNDKILNIPLDNKELTKYNIQTLITNKIFSQFDYIINLEDIEYKNAINDSLQLLHINSVIEKILHSTESRLQQNYRNHFLLHIIKPNLVDSKDFYSFFTTIIIKKTDVSAYITNINTTNISNTEYYDLLVSFNKYLVDYYLKYYIKKLHLEYSKNEFSNNYKNLRLSIIELNKTFSKKQNIEKKILDHKLLFNNTEIDNYNNQIKIINAVLKSIKEYTIKFLNYHYIFIEGITHYFGNELNGFIPELIEFYNKNESIYQKINVLNYNPTVDYFSTSNASALFEDINIIISTIIEKTPNQNKKYSLYILIIFYYSIFIQQYCNIFNIKNIKKYHSINNQITYLNNIISSKSITNDIFNNIFDNILKFTYKQYIYNIYVLYTYNNLRDNYPNLYSLSFDIYDKIIKCINALIHNEIEDNLKLHNHQSQTIIKLGKSRESGKEEYNNIYFHKIDFMYLHFIRKLIINEFILFTDSNIEFNYVYILHNYINMIIFYLNEIKTKIIRTSDNIIDNIIDNINIIQIILHTINEYLLRNGRETLIIPLPVYKGKNDNIKSFLNCLISKLFTECEFTNISECEYDTSKPPRLINFRRSITNYSIYFDNENFKKYIKYLANNDSEKSQFIKDASISYTTNFIYFYNTLIWYNRYVLDYHLKIFINILINNDITSRKKFLDILRLILELNALQTAILKFAKLEINSDIKLTKLQKNYYNEQFDIVNKQLATQEAILGGNGELNNYKLQFLLAEIYKRIKIFV